METTIKEGATIAKIALPKNQIDKGTMGQIRRITSHASVESPKFMPDCHKGKGCCIGMTSKLNKKVVPKFVGGDIGCGIISYPIGKLNITYKELDEIIRENVKMGKKVWDEPIITDDDIKSIIVDANFDAKNFSLAYFEKFNEKIFKSCPTFSLEWFKKLCIKIQIEKEYAYRSLGTLGGGNHYIEVNKDKKGIHYITIHSGSRAFGDKVCSYHQYKIDETKHFDYREYKKTMENIN